METKLVVLDLDETLVFATESKLTHIPDFVTGPYFVYKRPYVDEFINFCFEHFKVAVWTSSSELYGISIVENLFGNNHGLEFVWSRKKCITKFDAEKYEYNYVKDLKKVKKLGFSLESIISIDDTPRKLIRNFGNLVRVTPFEGDLRDEELLYLMPYLEELKCVENVRTVEKRGWRKQP